MTHDNHSMDALLGCGEDIQPQPNSPLELLGTSDIFIVTAGRAMIFAQKARAGNAIGERVHVATFDEGDLLPGMRCDDPPDDLLIQVTTDAGTGLRRYALPPRVDSALAREIDHWFRVMLPQITPLDGHEATPLVAGKRVTLAAGDIAMADSLIWVKIESEPEPAVELNGLAHPPSQSLLPVCAGLHLSAKESVTLDPLDTTALFATGPANQVMNSIVALLLATIGRRCDTALERFDVQVATRQTTEEAAEASVLEGLRRVIDVRIDGKEILESGQPFIDACRLVAEAAGIDLPPHLTIEEKSWMSPIEQVCRAASFRSRAVVLEDRWWKLQNGPILAKNEQGQPVALIPRHGRYDANIFAGKGPALSKRVDSGFANTLRNEAWTFYRPLPQKSLRLRDVLGFVAHGSLTDFALISCLAIAVALIGLVVPFAVGKLIDHVIPNASRNDLFVMVVVLATTAFSVSMLSLASGFAALRFQTRASYDLLAALLDRAISLPAALVRQFSAGDFCQRIMGVEQIRETLTQSTVSTLFAGISAIGYLFLIFYYNKELAFVALGFAFLGIVVTAGLAAVQVRFQYRIQNRLGRLDALMLQLFNGIEKIRVAAAERRMFTNWGRLFHQLWSNEFKAGVTTNILTVFNGAYTIAASMTLFWVYVQHGRGAGAVAGSEVSTGVFLAVYSAFSALLLSVTSVGAVIMPIMLISPIYKRIKPIIEVAPENAEIKTEVGPLRGDLMAEGVTFGYDLNRPPALEDVCLRAAPGEFVAIVGPSGSGKSTLLKILLGIETPQKGEVFFDGHSLRQLDIHSVRRQIGVVMQDTRIMPGFIRELLIGSANLTLEDAWTAARMAGIEDDLRAMPMGMFTYVSDTTISGGQRQRLLIARALITRPRLLLFDEATSALDSISQAVVRDSIDNLGVTRIVIAHRLSTIVNADRVYVLDSGRISQSGSYDELMSQDGLFKNLAARQLI